MKKKIKMSSNVEDIQSIKNHKMNYVFGDKIQIHRFRKHFIDIEF